ncbi:MAG TPA: ribosome biogenesis protein [Nitrososphaeraceae archaeon]|nr:ribosome biogenesis protein [Nitrososphaeraceae archaeon]
MIIAEAGLETVPSRIVDHTSVKNYARKIGRKPKEVLLNTSYHFTAMTHHDLPHWWKRGRPDIVHFSLLTALSTPLFLERKLDVYVSTIGNKLIFISKELRVPKSYFRFEGLMMNLFRDKIIDDPNSSKKLLELKENINFKEIISQIVKPNKVIGLTTKGIRSNPFQIIADSVEDKNKNYCFVVGGFQRGHFQEAITSIFDTMYSVSEYGLESHVVIARVLYEYEKLIQ